MSTHNRCGPACPQCGSPRGPPAGVVSQKLNSGMFWPCVSLGREITLAAITRPLPPHHLFRWCAPIVGGVVVVRNAESGPAPGFRGRVGGRVAEVESNGVSGCTRRPVLDFRPIGGVSVAALATPATSMWPLFAGRAPPGACLGARHMKKGTRHTNGCVAGAWCEVVGSAVTYSPTPSREQYHRRGRA